MKWCYVAFDVDVIKHAGVWKKIQMQSESIRKSTNKCDICIIGKEVHFFDGPNDLKEPKVLELSSLREILAEYDVLYFRWGGSNKLFNELLEEIKSKVLVVEIPTYPVMGEMRSKAKSRWQNKKFLKAIKGYLGGFALEYYYIRKQKRKADMFVLTTLQHSIAGTTTVNILNGIEPSKIALREVKRNSEALKLLAVANVSYWHGFDRIIRGLATYTGGKKVEFIVVGEGTELDRLKSLTKSLQLSSQVQFRGVLVGNDLDKCFDECDVAVGSLGLHRLGAWPSTLKSREYMARGIPFLMEKGESIENIPEAFPFIYEIPGDETPVDIESVLQWADNMDVQKAKEILRECAVEKCSWDAQMKKVVDAVEHLKTKN